MSSKIFSFEELTTLFYQIEIFKNSRPICPFSEDPNDDTILTPAHLCLGGKLDSLPVKKNVGIDRSETIDDARDATTVKKWGSFATSNHSLVKKVDKAIRDVAPGTQ